MKALAEFSDNGFTTYMAHTDDCSVDINELDTVIFQRDKNRVSYSFLCKQTFNMIQNSFEFKAMFR